VRVRATPSAPGDLAGARHNRRRSHIARQSSIVKFIEDNWGLPRITGSADAIAGSLSGLFDFAAKKGKGHAYGNAPNAAPFILDPNTGLPISTQHTPSR